jgi:hypothetical protein
MQRNQLAPKQILSWRNALRDRNSLDASVRNQTINTPFAAIIRVFCDLEPATAYTTVRGRGADFLEVRHDGTFVAGLDHVVGARCEGMAPGELCGRAGGDGYHF